MVVMVLPGILGRYLDDRYGVRFLTPLGLLLGMSLAGYLLWLLGKILTPPARGEPIPFEEDADEDAGEDWDDEEPKT